LRFAYTPTWMPRPLRPKGLWVWAELIISKFPAIRNLSKLFTNVSKRTWPQGYSNTFYARLESHNELIILCHYTGFSFTWSQHRLSNRGLERGVFKGASEMVKGRRKMSQDLKMSGGERV
jgi:hypothetical protein